MAKKLGKRAKQASSKEDISEGQQAYEKVLNMTNQRDTHQNYNEMSPHTCQKARMQ